MQNSGWVSVSSQLHLRFVRQIHLAHNVHLDRITGIVSRVNLGTFRLQAVRALIPRPLCAVVEQRNEAVGVQLADDGRWRYNKS